MSELVFAPPPPSTLSTAAAAIPVRRVFCVGRNFWDHGIEMGGNPEREPPFFFTKFTDSIVDASAGSVSIPYPSLTSSFHYECELVVVLGKQGYMIPLENAMEHVYGYGVGIDWTRRDMQNEAKQTRKPWDMSKSFDFAAPVGAVVEKEAAQNPPIETRRMELQANGVTKQETSLDLMIWSVPEMVSRLSHYCALAPGDVLFCGTPAGVGAVNVGDVVTATVDGLPQCVCTIAPPV